LGKTWVGFKCLATLPKGTNLLFLSETIVRKNTVLEDAAFYKKIYGIDPLEGYNVKFITYQSAAKFNVQYYFPNSKSTLIILDEIHEILSDKRILFILNSNLDGVKLLGLSATIDRKTRYIIQKEESTKFDYLKRFCPIIYTYNINNAREDDNVRDTKFFILKHDLDTRKNFLTGAKGKQWHISEKLQYEYLDKTFKKALFMPNTKGKDDYVRMCATNRARFLYALPSKIPIVKELVTKLEGKTLVFGLDNKSLIEICPNSIVETNKNLIQDLRDFKEGKTMVTCSNKMLKQGENIPNLTNLIYHSYYGKIVPTIQILGRLRKAEDQGIVILLLTSNTQEEIWFKNATEGLLVDWIYCRSVDEIISKICKN